MPPALPVLRWCELIARDKKVTVGAVRFILLSAIGRGLVTSDVRDADLEAVLS